MIRGRPWQTSWIRCWKSPVIPVNATFFQIFAEVHSSLSAIACFISREMHRYRNSDGINSAAKARLRSPHYVTKQRDL
jgi:hypothetical protein